MVSGKVQRTEENRAEESRTVSGTLVKEDVSEKGTSEQTPEGGKGYLEAELPK